MASDETSPVESSSQVCVIVIHTMQNPIEQNCFHYGGNSFDNLNYIVCAGWNLIVNSSKKLGVLLEQLTSWRYACPTAAKTKAVINFFAILFGSTEFVPLNLLNS